MLIIGAVALIAFGPDQLPKVARKAGQAIRDVQNTSQSFIREMERAADEPEHPWTPPPAPAPAPYPDVAGVTPPAPPETHEGERGHAASASEKAPPSDAPR